MTRASSRAVIALTLLASSWRTANAQDTTATPTPPHQLAVDTSRLRPFHRAYDIVVRRGDSATVIGERDVDLAMSEYSGNPAWLLTESRGGAVTSLDSLFLSADMRPLHWASAQGLARLGLEFVGDSVYGAISGPAIRQNIVMAGRSDLLVSAAMTDAVLPLLALAPGWADSASVMEVDASGARVVPASITVVGEEDLATDSATTQPTWVVAMRSDSAQVLYWVNKNDGTILRTLQPLRAHTGTDLELRLRPPVLAAPAPPGNRNE